MDFVVILSGFFFFFKQKTAYELRISDWSSDVCSSDLSARPCPAGRARFPAGQGRADRWEVRESAIRSSRPAYAEGQRRRSRARRRLGNRGGAGPFSPREGGEEGAGGNCKSGEVAAPEGRGIGRTERKKKPSESKSLRPTPYPVSAW